MDKVFTAIAYRYVFTINDYGVKLTAGNEWARHVMEEMLQIEHSAYNRCSWR